MVLLFTLFPATASTVGCIVTAGRRDLYLAFLAPLVAFSAMGLLTHDDSRVQGLGILGAFFGGSLLLLHHVVSRGTIDAIRLQWRSERLLEDLAHERGEFTGVNDQLAAINRRLTHQATHDSLTGLYNRRGRWRSSTRCWRRWVLSIRWGCCSATSTGSRRSTTRSATAAVTGSSASSPTASPAVSSPIRWPDAWAATSSSS